jgi:hypothetical protein
LSEIRVCASRFFQRSLWPRAFGTFSHTKRCGRRR